MISFFHFNDKDTDEDKKFNNKFFLPLNSLNHCNCILYIKVSLIKKTYQMSVIYS